GVDVHLCGILQRDRAGHWILHTVTGCGENHHSFAAGELDGTIDMVMPFVVRIAVADDTRAVVGGMADRPRIGVRGIGAQEHWPNEVPAGARGAIQVLRECRGDTKRALPMPFELELAG